MLIKKVILLPELSIILNIGLKINRCLRISVYIRFPRLIQTFYFGLEIERSFPYNEMERREQLCVII